MHCYWALVLNLHFLGNKIITDPKNKGVQFMHQRIMLGSLLLQPTLILVISLCVIHMAAHLVNLV